MSIGSEKSQTNREIVVLMKPALRTSPFRVDMDNIWGMLFYALNEGNNVLSREKGTFTGSGAGAADSEALIWGVGRGSGHLDKSVQLYNANNWQCR